MTESPRHTIYTPLMFYDGDDEDVILNFAKKYHLVSVAFPLLNEAISNAASSNP